MERLGDGRGRRNDERGCLGSRLGLAGLGFCRKVRAQGLALEERKSVGEEEIPWCGGCVYVYCVCLYRTKEDDDMTTKNCVATPKEGMRDIPCRTKRWGRGHIHIHTRYSVQQQIITL